MSDTILHRIREAGVVGSGGAGFPTAVKAGSKAEIIIANGAECEPLLHKDLELMQREPQAVVEGMKLMMSSTGARRGILGVKQKYKEILSDLISLTERSGIEIDFLGDFYPTGDEYVLVYETTRRLIPSQGIPLDVGVVVNNVETFRNLALATQGKPVISKYVTVAGAVAHPSTFEVPIGLPFKDIIDAAGGATIDEYALFVSGMMMGKLETDGQLPVTKTCAGIIVLPKEHRLVQRKQLPQEAMMHIGKSACDQCSYCTELCPRYILGYDVQPHKVMRSLSFTASGEDLWNQYSQLCCSCGLCTLYSCPEDLYPKEACDKAKVDLRKKQLPWNGEREVHLHPMYDGRHVPLNKLIQRLGVEQYNVPAHFSEKEFLPAGIRLPLQQHLGVPASPLVAVGQFVKKGTKVADVPDSKLGACIHSSIDGYVKAIIPEIIIERT